VLAGLVERVAYQNAENGFCVIRVKARSHRELVTVVGHAATIAAGEWITASGDWVNDRTHGQQFASLTSVLRPGTFFTCAAFANTSRTICRFDSYCGKATHVHNYHCKRVAGLVRLGILYGSRVGAWYLDNGMVARNGVARAPPRKTRALKTHGRLSGVRRENRPAVANPVGDVQGGTSTGDWEAAIF
jgi:hypothetical protein